MMIVYGDPRRFIRGTQRLAQMFLEIVLQSIHAMFELFDNTDRGDRTLAGLCGPIEDSVQASLTSVQR